MQIGAFGAPPAALESLHQVQAARQLNNVQPGQQSGRSDSVSISGFGRQKNVLENIMKQKEGLKEYRSTLIAHTLEKGDDIKGIQPELDEIDQQLQDLDEMAKKYLMEQFKSQKEEAEEEKAAPQEEAPKTEEEVQAAKLNSVMGMAGGIEQAKAADAAVNRLGRESARLEAQVVRDGLYGSNTSAKRAEIRELKAQAEEAAGNRAAQMGNVAREAEKAGKPEPGKVITEQERLEAEKAAEEAEE